MRHVHFDTYNGRLSIWADIPHDEFLEMHGDAETDGAALFARFAHAHNERLIASDRYMNRCERLPIGHTKPGIIYLDTNDDTRALCPLCGDAVLEGGL